jgi:hypothetical protein
MFLADHLSVAEYITLIMSNPQISISTPSKPDAMMFLHLHGLIFETSILYWQVPDEHGPGPGYGPVRTSVISGWYFTVGSPTAGAAGRSLEQLSTRLFLEVWDH